MKRDRRSARVRIVILEPDEATRRAIKQHVSSSAYEVVEESADPSAASQLFSQARPDLVFMAVAADVSVTHDAIRRIRETLPAAAVVLVSNEASPQLILSCMRAGANEFLVRPLDPAELDGALARLQKFWEHSSGASKGGRIWTTYPAKGGVGASCLATNLALSLQSRPGAKVVLVDFNLQVGDLALMLDMTPRHSYAHALGDGDLDEVKVRTILSHHSSGLGLLTMADRPEESNLVRREHVGVLLDLLRGMFEHIIVDLGRHIDERTIELLDRSDLVLLLTALDVPTIRNTRSYLDLFRRLEISAERTRLVVNRVQDGRRITNRDLVRTVGQEIFFGLPNDFVAASAAIDSGNPVVFNSPRSKLAEAYRELARALSSSSGQPGAARPAEQGQGVS
ncbi:MAG: AAA family ATPase [bacterium]